jgi:mono/diheme cytochrome c family protein
MMIPTGPSGPAPRIVLGLLAAGLASLLIAACGASGAGTVSTQLGAMTPTETGSELTAPGSDVPRATSSPVPSRTDTAVHSTTVASTLPAGFSSSHTVKVPACASDQLVVLTRAGITRGGYGALDTGLLDGVRFLLASQPAGAGARVRFSLGGYGFPVCPRHGHAVQFETLATAPGIFAYGLLATGVTQWFIDGRRPDVLADLASPAGTFFIAALPEARCPVGAADAAGVTLSTLTPGARTGVAYRAPLILNCRWQSIVGVTASGGDAPGDAPTVAPTSPGTAAGPAITPPLGLRGAALERFSLGESVFVQSGCLGCHAIGAQGNSGPGQNLAGIGLRLSAAKLTRSLVHAVAPMPSFAALPPRRLRALVAFLADLRDHG